MTKTAQGPAWEGQKYELAFEVEAPQHIPRGWERLPRSPHATHHKGRKVWKRPDVRQSSATGLSVGDNVGGNRSVLSDVSTNTHRIVKKQRLKNELVHQDSMKNKPDHYLATLRDATLNTPRRKQKRAPPIEVSPRSTRKSGSLESNNKRGRDAFMGTNFNPVCESPSFKPVQEPLDSPMPSADELGFKDKKIHQSLDQLVPGPCASVTGKHDEFCISTEQPYSNDEPSNHEARSPVLQTANPVKSPQKSWSSASPQKADKTPGRDTGPSTCYQSDLQPTIQESGISCQTPSVRKASESGITKSDFERPPKAQELVTPSRTPAAKTSTAEMLPVPTPIMMELNSPQIGTTLLRRESLRRKGSPRKSLNARRTRSPQKKQLKKRDTLQEREILQRFGEEVDAQNPEQTSPASEGKDLPLSVPTEPVIENTQGLEQGQYLSNSVADHVKAAEATLNSRDLKRVVEAIKACEDAHPTGDPASILQCQSDADALIEANEPDAKAEKGQAQQTITEVCEKADLPLRKTRSGARFSDDTSMLKDFLSRAQARKASKTPVLSPRVPKSLQESPKRSPRRKQATASPEKGLNLKPKSGASKKGSSPNKAKLEMTFEDDLDDETVIDPESEPEAVSCRRSARTRLPAPPKTPPGAPSFIPVRRADGTDPVILQRTQAQELATATRANTRRNKGQAKPPQYALRDLPVDDAEIIMADKQSAANGKAVAWAENLASYQGSTEVADELEDQRPKVRRLRGLGAMNGAPATKKKAAAAPPSNGTPAPKRRGKLAG